MVSAVNIAYVSMLLVLYCKYYNDNSGNIGVLAFCNSLLAFVAFECSGLIGKLSK